MYCLLVIVNINKPRILVLHSYNNDFSWVTAINEPINRILGGGTYSLRYHYMDTKRHPDDQYKAKAGIEVRNVIKEW